MPRLSVAIIARDEADRLPDALRSVEFADEVVVLDSGSRDGTVEVARRLGARVVETDWPGHVAQKNRALAECRHPWVLAIDADERVGEELRRSVTAALQAEPVVDGFRVRRRNHYLGRPLRAGGWYPDARVRLVRRRVARWVGEDPHDLLAVDGKVGNLEGDLLHHPYRDLAEHLGTIDRYTARFAEVTSSRAGILDVLVRPPWTLFRNLVLRAGIRDGVLGFHLAGLAATYTLLKWSRLYLAQRHLCDISSRPRDIGSTAGPGRGV